MSERMVLVTEEDARVALKEARRILHSRETVAITRLATAATHEDVKVARARVARLEAALTDPAAGTPARDAEGGE